MAYFAPFIDSSGLHLPAFTDIKSYLLQNFANIYGQSVVTNISSADVQWNTILALMANDGMQGLQLAVNGMGPTTAVSTQQDLLYKLNGIDRNEPTYSTCLVIVTGTPDIVIAAGAVLDTNGNVWNLPTNLTIPGSGSITVNATCTIQGAVSANIGALNTRVNPQDGWTSVINTVAAIPGLPAEQDSNFRSRQAISVALPSRTLVDGTLAGIAATPGVTRYNNGAATVSGASPIENPTGSTDVFGNPAHSISMVVEGGTDLAVATSIYLNKTPGCFTNGTTSVNVTDPTTGGEITINFFRPTAVPIFSALSIHGFNGYTTDTTAAIKQAVTDYLNSLQIGESLTISALYSAANSVMPNLAVPLFSIRALTAGLSGGSESTTDISIDFDEVVSGLLVNCVITLV